MKSAIERLVLDNSSFMEDIPTSESYNNLLGECDKIYKELKASLTPEQVELLDKLIFNHMGLEAEATERYLIQGFKAAVKLMVECL